MSRTALDAIKNQLGPKGWIDDPAELAPYLKPWRGAWNGSADLLVRPATVQEVAAVTKICAEHHVPLTIQGGNTGLVGGQVPEGGVLLSTQRLNALREVDPVEDVIVAEAGVTIAQVQEAAASHGRLFPLSFAAEGSATVGGAIATNAGGTSVLRYGSTRDLVLGVEAVLPDGRILHDLNRLRKNNSGYDLKQLFIGAEGTLGIVTAAVLKLHSRIGDRAVALVGVDDPARAIDLLLSARAACGGNISAFELISGVGVTLAARHVPGVRLPLGTSPPWYVLIDLGYPQGDRARPAIEALILAGYEAGLISDGVIAENETQIKALWRIREVQSEAQRASGPSWSFDLSVPVSRMPSFIKAVGECIARNIAGAVPMPFGHVGDGNIHYNIMYVGDGGADDMENMTLRINEIIFDNILKFQGSISAEHGIGKKNRENLLRYKDGLQIDLMKNLKCLMDGNLNMNRDVIFRN
ncbi:MAG: hydroxyacid dehydrogenase [Alphaproteobacteria bacterium HGW-Alphaproteobacteria-5]|jgi:FAD/FMN-containing dehydrogenase|nr:MAG: hydroxyacid dehydrogenase [Alphaproteobacteria bacterium HGW-Alphaproteobacteria-5]